ncbi:MAG: hypothetical protein ACREMA_09890 [Longimicrobiales bacterium]
MTRIPTGNAQALLLIALVISACERRADERTSGYEAAPATVPAPVSVPAPTTVPALSDEELSVHLDAAHDNFVKKELGKAGDELRSGAERLKQAAVNAPAGARKDLTDAADEIGKVEGDVRSGAMTSLETLDRHLARAGAALARMHYLRATDAWVAQDARTTGRELVAAADQLEAATRRLGHAVSAEAGSFANHARDLGHKLAEGAKVAESDIGVTMRGLGREIEKLAHKVRAS